MSVERRVAMKSSSRVSALWILFLVLVSGPVSGQEKVSNEAAAFRDRVMRPVVYRVEGMDRVRVRQDLIYKKDGSIELKMDISTPEKSNSGASVFRRSSSSMAAFPPRSRSSRRIGGFTSRGAASSRRPEWPR
jgi:hypothetical protein